MNAAIAQHLNVAESAIIEIQEWSRCLWVRVRGIGARFVSKKVAKVQAVKTIEERLVEAGGSRWQKNGNDRIYFNDIKERYGLELKFYGSGNVSSAKLMGNTISNSEGKRIWAKCRGGKLFWDVKAQKWVNQGIDPDVAKDVILSIEVECNM